MALNPNKLQFLVTQLRNSEFESISGIIAQIFSYLDAEIKDNPIFDYYESERSKWENWPDLEEFSYPSWTLPATLDDSKSLAYTIYRNTATKGHAYLQGISLDLFTEKQISYNIERFNRTFSGYFIQALEDIANANPELEGSAPKHIKSDTVFIVHGHDTELKTEILLLLNRAGVNSFVLHEQPDLGRTIIDKLIQETDKAGYAVALLTPDDLTTEGKNRARQNVILEIGYFIGKLGKERLRLITKGEVEIPSDLQGILYEKHDPAGAWKMRLLKEIQAVGIYVDLQSALNTF